MKICRVEGTVVATAKHPAFAGTKLMIVQPLDEKSAPKGARRVEMSGCGPGKAVAWMPTSR